MKNRLKTKAPRKKSPRAKGAPRATHRTSARLKELWATPEFREKMKQRDQARINAAKCNPAKFYRYGVPDGMHRAEAEQLWARANELADRFIEGLKAKGELPDVSRQVTNNSDGGVISVPPTDEGKAEGALRQAFVLAVGPSTPRVKTQAINIVLTYTKATSHTEGKLKAHEMAEADVLVINRICIRRVTDGEGRCAEADVYIVLPKDWRGDAILRDIHTNMPGLKQVVWEFEPDGPKVYAPRSNSVAQAVIELMRTRELGQTPLSYVRTQLSLTSRQFGRLKEDLAKAASNITATLREMGVLYRVEGRGSATKGYLAKVA